MQCIAADMIRRFAADYAAPRDTERMKFVWHGLAVITELLAPLASMQLTRELKNTLQ